MKIYITFKLEALTDPSEQDQKKGIRSVCSFIEQRDKNGLKEQVVVSVKSTVEVSKALIGKEVICSVEQSIIASGFGKPNVYYRASSVKQFLPQ